MAELEHKIPYCIAHLQLVGDIRLQCHGLTAGTDDLVGNFLHLRAGAPQRSDCHAVCGKRKGGGSANAGPGTGDQGNGRRLVHG